MISKVVGIVGIVIGVTFMGVMLYMNKNGLLFMGLGEKAALMGIFTYCVVSGTLLLQ